MMMSVERPFEAWEEVQRQGQDLADKLAQGFNGLIQSHINPPSFPWPTVSLNQPNSKLFDIEFPRQVAGRKDFGIGGDVLGVNGVGAIMDIGNKIGQAGMEFGACLNGVFQQFFRGLGIPMMSKEDAEGGRDVPGDWRLSGGISDVGLAVMEDLGSFHEKLKDFGFKEDYRGGSDGEAGGWFDLSLAGLFSSPQGFVNLSTTYDSRTNDVESSLVARGELWRLEASQANSTSGNSNSSLFLVQLGPLLFLRDSTLLLPVNLSKQHLLWYGYDRKNGMHSLCPAVWSKDRRWLLMSMLCLSPLACSFVDMQFPNGQLTYVSGEGLTTSAFVPLGGGLLQVQGQFPGEMRFSFSSKNKWGTRITPMVQWPDKSFSLGVDQALAWQRSGLLVRPTIQLSVVPTFGGSNPGLKAEVIHSWKEHLSFICGCAYAAYPSAYASISIGKSKGNGNIGQSGMVVRVDVPLSGVRHPSLSVQLNTGLEF